MDHMNIPRSKHCLFEGSIVILKKFPDNLWVVHNGRYWYEDQQHRGWFFKAIPQGDIMPILPEDLEGIVIVSDNRCEPHSIRPCPPCPHPDKSVKFTKENYEELKSAFIVVSDMEELNKLSLKDVHDGRMVKVNDVEGEPKYFKFSEESQTWVPDDTLEKIYLQIEDLINSRCIWTWF